MQKEWATGVLGNLKNFGVKIISHEKTQVHLDANIAFGRRKAGQRTDRVQEQAIDTETTFWRNDFLRIINIVKTLAMTSLALRGHHKHAGDSDCHGGNPPNEIAGDSDCHGGNPPNEILSMGPLVRHDATGSRSYVLCVVSVELPWVRRGTQ